MGSKSSNVAAPDPRLVEAQIRSMGIQDSAIQGIMDLSKSLQPLQERQLREGLDDNDEARGNAREDRSYALERRGVLTGLQDRQVADATDFNVAQRGEELAGQAGADVAQTFAAARGRNERDMLRSGIDPNRGAYFGANTRMSVAEALANASARTGARREARLEGRALTDRAANTLAGYPSMGMATSGQSAQFALNGINLGNAGSEGMMSGARTAAGIAGQMGANATGMYGSQVQYKLGADRQAADNNPFATLVGAGAKLGAAYIGSDRRLKTDIRRVGKDERTGLGIYEFAYIDGDGTRFRGVMADEVEKVDPKAVRRDRRGFALVNYKRIGIPMEVVQ